MNHETENSLLGDDGELTKDQKSLSITAHRFAKKGVYVSKRAANCFIRSAIITPFAESLLIDEEMDLAIGVLVAKGAGLFLDERIRNIIFGYQLLVFSAVLVHESIREIRDPEEFIWENFRKEKNK